MISNMESQLKQQGAGDRVKEVLAEVPRVRKDAGLSAAGHAVQPDRRHAGRLQRADGPVQGAHRRVRRPDARLLRRDASARATRRSSQAAAKHAKKEPITGRPADLLKPEWDELRTAALALKGCNGTDEDVLTYAMFPQVAPKFFATAGRRSEEPGQGPGGRGSRRAKPAAAAAKAADGKGPITSPSPTRSGSARSRTR